MKEFALYTAARLGIFAACYAVLLGVAATVGGREQARAVWVLVAAVLVSAVISAYALRGLRQRVTAGVYARADRIAAAKSSPSRTDR